MSVYNLQKEREKFLFESFHEDEPLVFRKFLSGVTNATSLANLQDSYRNNARNPDLDHIYDLKKFYVTQRRRAIDYEYDQQCRQKYSKQSKPPEVEENELIENMHRQAQYLQEQERRANAAREEFNSKLDFIQKQGDILGLKLLHTIWSHLQNASVSFPNRTIRATNDQLFNILSTIEKEL